MLKQVETNTEENSTSKNESKYRIEKHRIQNYNREKYNEIKREECRDKIDASWIKYDIRETKRQSEKIKKFFSIQTFCKYERKSGN